MAIKIIREPSKPGLNGGEMSAKCLEITVRGGHPGRGHSLLPAYFILFSLWQRVIVTANVGIKSYGLLGESGSSYPDFSASFLVFLEAAHFLVFFFFFFDVNLLTLNL